MAFLRKQVGVMDIYMYVSVYVQKGQKEGRKEGRRERGREEGLQAQIIPMVNSFILKKEKNTYTNFLRK